MSASDPERDAAAEIARRFVNAVAAVAGLGAAMLVVVLAIAMDRWMIG